MSASPTAVTRARRPGHRRAVVVAILFLYSSGVVHHRNQCETPSPALFFSIIAVRRYVDPCPGLSCRARRPLPAERRPKFTAFLRYIDHYSYPPCRARRPLLAECRPKFISVALWGVRFQECSTPSARFNLCENCYISQSPCSPGTFPRKIASPEAPVHLAG
jgi:hypothetical protein